MQIKFIPKGKKKKKKKKKTHQTTKTRDVSQCGLAIYIKKALKGKRRIMESQIFHHAKIY